MIKASQIVELAITQIGTKEKKDNNVKYNTAYYGGEVHGAGFDWNTVFVWWLFNSLGASSLFCGGEKASRALFVYQKYVESKDFYKEPSVFRPGDILAIKERVGPEKVNKLGIVESIDLESETVYAIIGDSKNAVERKGVHLSNVVGVCRPSYIAEDEEEHPEEGDRVDVPVEDPEETPTDPEDPEGGDGEEIPPEDSGCEEKDDPFVDVIEKPVLHPVVKLPDTSAADINLVTIAATKKIYSLMNDAIKLGRAFLSIRMTDGLDNPATGRLNVNGYEFAFSGAIQIPERYLKTGVNDLVLYASDGSVYSAHAFVKSGDRIDPIPALQSDLVDIARGYEQMLDIANKLSTRVSVLEKATEGIDLADIVLSDEGLDELSKALENIAAEDGEIIGG
jgi:hypothetical protein